MSGRISRKRNQPYSAEINKARPTVPKNKIQIIKNSHLKLHLLNPRKYRYENS